VIGVNERGEKHFLAIEDGVRESTQSWREILLKLKSRRLNPPKLAIGDGAIGFWAALEEVYPETRQQRCWMHKTMNVLNCLPKSAQPKAKQALHNIWQAETQADAEKAFDLFIKTYEPKYPKAAICLHKDREELMALNIDKEQANRILVGKSAIASALTNDRTLLTKKSVSVTGRLIPLSAKITKAFW